VCALTLRHLIVRLGLDGVNDVREFDRVLDEEHRDVVADDVPVPLLGVELDRKAADVTDGVLNTMTSELMPNSLNELRRRTALPFDPWTVLNRMKTGVDRLLSVSTGADVYLLARSS